jgi:hypothetical protein
MSGAGGLRWLVVAVTLVVVATLVAGIVAVGPPSQARKRKLDDARVDDLVRIEAAVKRYADQHAAVPPALSALDEAPGLRVHGTDPETGAAYEYEPVGEHAYRLCAVFSAASDDNGSSRRYPAETWHHGIGRQCFEHHEPVPAK